MHKRAPAGGLPALAQAPDRRPYPRARQPELARISSHDADDPVANADLSVLKGTAR